MIENQADYIFLYEDYSVDVNRKVTISFENASIDTVLSAVLGEEVGYVMNGRQVSLFRKTKPAASKPVLSATQKTVPARLPSVKGNISDRQGLGVIGAFILEQGTSNGCVTDVDGNFAMNLSNPDAVLSTS